MATVLNWERRRRRRDTEGPKTKKKLADDDGKQEDNERWSGQKEKNKMEGRKLCPCRESPIVSPGLSHSEKVVESRCFWGSFCPLSYLDIGRRGRKKTTSMDEEATQPRPFFFLLSAFAYAEKSDQTNTMLFLPIPLFLKHLPPSLFKDPLSPLTRSFFASPPCFSALVCAGGENLLGSTNTTDLVSFHLLEEEEEA